MPDPDVDPGMDLPAFPYLDDSTLLDGRAEKLLAGEIPVNPPAGARELRDMLSALRAPTRPHELAGEAGAVAVFSAVKERAALKEKLQLKEKAQLKERASNVRRLPTHLVPKIGVATTAALVLFTGVAAAAVTGSLPGPLQAFAHSRLGAPAATGSSTGEAAVSVAAAGLPRPTDSGTPATTPSRPSSPPTPSLSAHPQGAGPVPGGSSTAGLCRAHTKGNNGHGTQTAPSKSLQAAAVGAAKTVSQFCAAYLPTVKSPGARLAKPPKSGNGPGEPGSNGHPPRPTKSPSKGAGEH